MFGFIHFLVSLALHFFSVAILVRALMTWVPKIPRQPQFVSRVELLTEPILVRVRNLVPKDATWGFDFSPVLAFLALQTVNSLLGYYWPN